MDIPLLVADTCALADMRDPSGVDTRRKLVISKNRDPLIKIERMVVQGQVLSAGLDKSLASAQLELFDAERGNALRRRARTDSDSRFALPGYQSAAGICELSRRPYCH